EKEAAEQTGALCRRLLNLDNFCCGCHCPHLPLDAMLFLAALSLTSWVARKGAPSPRERMGTPHYLASTAAPRPRGVTKLKCTLRADEQTRREYQCADDVQREASLFDPCHRLILRGTADAAEGQPASSARVIVSQ